MRAPQEGAEPQQRENPEGTDWRGEAQGCVLVGFDTDRMWPGLGCGGAWSQEKGSGVYLDLMVMHGWG